MGVKVGKVHAVIFEPIRVGDAMSIHRSQVFTPFTVYVQFDGHTLATPKLLRPQPDLLCHTWNFPEQGSGRLRVSFCCS